VAIMREPEYNVAYWNLHDRRLEHDGSGYTVNGRPLAFFHFSGFDPEHPLILSRHQNRTDVLEAPPLERLLGEYAHAVLDAGHIESRHWPYEFEALGDGTRRDDRAGPQHRSSIGQRSWGPGTSQSQDVIPPTS
jgi:hypothetical protein